MRRNCAAAVVQASTIQEASVIDVFCHPVDLAQAECNCGNFTPSMPCLVPFIPDQSDTTSGPEPPDLESLNLHDDNEGSDEDESDDDLHQESFRVKGSFYQEQYQQALLKCDDAKRKHQAVPVRVEFEPNNIEDKNAIKFDVYFDDGWHIIGYCGVNKIPKLRKAMKGKEIRSLSLLYIKREWIPWQSKFSFYASVSVVKRGQWERDSPQNHYNSNLD